VFDGRKGPSALNPPPCCERKLRAHGVLPVTRSFVAVVDAEKLGQQRGRTREVHVHERPTNVREAMVSPDSINPEPSGVVVALIPITWV